MNPIEWYIDALRTADADKNIDRSVLRSFVLIMAGLLVLVAIVAVNVALIAWKWWLGVPVAAYLIYRAVRWAVTEPEKET